MILRTRGQFPVIFALTLSLLIIISALISYHVLISRRGMNSKVWIHSIINAKEDLGRVLAASLSKFTYEYNITGNTITSEFEAIKILERWKLIFSLSYNSLGIKLELQSNGTVIQHETIYNLTMNSNIYRIYVPEIRIPAGHFYNCSWGQAFGISAAYAILKLNLTRVGVIGWKYLRVVLLAINITSIYTDTEKNKTYIKFTIFNENSYINSLNKSNIFIYVNESRLPSSSLENVMYEGLGVYKIIINQVIDIQTLEIIIRDKRGIIVKTHI